LAKVRDGGTLARMAQLCEVCENFRPEEETDPDQRFVYVTFESRRVLLCTGHARIAENSGVASLEQLRAYYGEGRRSFLGRRSRDPVSRTGERRKSPGRRASDTRQ
jgi:hypothetical protein